MESCVLPPVAARARLDPRVGRRRSGTRHCDEGGRQARDVLQTSGRSDEIQSKRRVPACGAIRFAGGAAFCGSGQPMRSASDTCTRSGHKISLVFCLVGKDYLRWGVALVIATNLGVGLPTEPIGSVPRPDALIAGVQAFEDGRSTQEELDALYDSAIRDTIERFEATGSPVITDGEQSKQSFATYSIRGLENVSPDDIPILFADGHFRNFPRLSGGPFHYRTPADVYLETAQRHAHVPVKQAVISASAMSLLYPQSGVRGYSSG